jgi:hypothetical protein
MGDDLAQRSASLVPMLSSAWQNLQDPDKRELDPDEGKFFWDGKFDANARMLGNWKVITQVVEIAEFDPAAKFARPRNALFSAITFNNGGKTSDPTWLWSGDTLMDLSKYQALKMTMKTIDDKDYLFVEAGGFGTRNKPGWKPQLMVLLKQ